MYMQLLLAPCLAVNLLNTSSLSFTEEDIEILTEKVEDLELTLEKEREEATVKLQEIETKANEGMNALRAEVTLLSKTCHFFYPIANILSFLINIK